jgi:hypothetical protein
MTSRPKTVQNDMKLRDTKSSNQDATNIANPRTGQVTSFEQYMAQKQSQATQNTSKKGVSRPSTSNPGCANIEKRANILPNMRLEKDTLSNDTPKNTSIAATREERQQRQRQLLANSAREPTRAPQTRISVTAELQRISRTSSQQKSIETPKEEVSNSRRPSKQSIVRSSTISKMKQPKLPASGTTIEGWRIVYRSQLLGLRLSRTYKVLVDRLMQTVRSAPLKENEGALTSILKDYSVTQDTEFIKKVIWEHS